MDDQLGDYRIERMSLPDVEIAINWAAREGWNPGLNDAACFSCAARFLPASFDA